jgi:hypothetical protein
MIGNPMRGSLGFPTSASRRNSESASPVAFCRCDASRIASTFSAITEVHGQIEQILVNQSLYCLYVIVEDEVRG